MTRITGMIKTTKMTGTTRIATVNGLTVMIRITRMAGMTGITRIIRMKRDESPGCWGDRHAWDDLNNLNDWDD